MNSARILIVESNETKNTPLEEELLRSLGYTACATVPSGGQAVEVAASNCPDLALIDLGLDGGLSGIETAEQLRDELDVPVIYLTDGDDALLQRAAASQPYGYVVKPVEARQLNLSIQTALALHEKERRCRESDRALRRTIGELRRKSRIMDTILDSTRDGVVAADGTGRILFANAQAERIVGAVEDMKPADLYDASERQAKHGLFEIDKQTYVPTDQLPLIRALQGKTTDDKEVFVRNDRVPEGAFISTTGRTLWGDDRREIEGGVVFFRDVTRERKAEADLQQTIGKWHDQTRLMQTVFDNMEEGVVVADTAGNFLLTNQRREQIVGMKLIAAEPADWPATFGAFHLDKKTHVPTDELPLVRGMRGEATEEVELFIRNERRPDGAYIRARGRPLLDGDGNVIAGVAIFSDITKYKETEAELERTIHDLRTQAQLVETVFESISDGVVVANAEGQFTIFNSSAERIVGLGMMETAPDRWSQQYGIFHADKTTPFSSDQLPLVHAMQGKSTDDVEMFIRNEKRPDGVYISVNGRPLQKTREGHSGGVIAFRDVTNRKVAEIELKQAVHDLRNQSELMEATFNGISDGLAIVNTAGELLRVNPVGKQIFGFDSMDPSQARLLIKWGTYYYPDRETLIRPEDLPLNRVIFQGESVSDMDIFVRNQKKPEGFFVRLSARPLLHAGGGIRGGVIIFRDATDQILAEEALTQAFAQGRLEIIDTILHNIGNAINSVTIGIGTLQETLSDNPMLRRLHTLADLLEAHQNDWVDYIAHDPQGQKVLPYIILLAKGFAAQNDEMAKTVARVEDRAQHIADIIRIQKALDRPHMNQKDVDLEHALGAAIKVLQDSIYRRGIAVEIGCRGAPREIRIQESQFHQMMVNLIKNSIEAIDDLAAADGLKETPRICIRAYPEGDFLHLDVKDNGIGIASKHAKLVFAAGYTTKKTGSGLGLHSAANFVIGMGGQIHVLSDGAGKGATLRVMLRLSSVTPAARKPFAESGHAD